MQDKEVGELWKERLATLEAMWPDRKGASAFELDMVISLIRKLVEERAEKSEYLCLQTKRTSACVRLRHDHAKEARDDFGIPEEGWK